MVDVDYLGCRHVQADPQLMSLTAESLLGFKEPKWHQQEVG